jgi:hypothetical protein
MNPTKTLILALVLLAAFPPAAGATDGGSGQWTADSGGAAGSGCQPQLPAPGPRPPEHGSSGRGIIFNFDLLTENPVVAANVSDPAAVSASVVVVVRNNASAPLSVRLTATINLGATVTLEPSQTPLMLYQATTNVIVAVTLPENTTSDSIAYLTIDGVCDQNPTVTNTLQIRVTVKQWHRVTIERFSLSSSAPLEKDQVTLNARVINSGNGPSRFSASALVDGKPLQVKVDGYSARPNDTVSLASGRFFMLAATWQATYGHHNFVVVVTDIGRSGEINASEVMSKDTRVASVFVGYNYRDLIPFLYITIIILVAAALIGYRYRKKLVLRLRRLRRRLGRAGPGEEGDVELEDGEYGEDEDYEDGEYEDEDDDYDDEDGEGDEEDEGGEDDEADEEDEGGEDDEADEEEAPPPVKVGAPAKKQPAPAPKRPAATSRAPPAGRKAAAKVADRPGVTVGRPAKRPAARREPELSDVELVEEE